MCDISVKICNKCFILAFFQLILSGAWSRSTILMIWTKHQCGVSLSYSVCVVCSCVLEGTGSKHRQNCTAGRMWLMWKHILLQSVLDFGGSCYPPVPHKDTHTNQKGLLAKWQRHNPALTSHPWTFLFVCDQPDHTWWFHRFSKFLTVCTSAHPQDLM